ncbi:MAG: class I SAM-dependent methyltransferase [Alphaproteobacteria bacterium]|nr:class I SAM-dependent methyltransferase [Alphaproteobacteria bacterium]MDE2629771.1 class I SAM-dependent methyltransferase [Alphaproteobacteria bacterium]
MHTMREHWDGVYATKGETEVSWYQPRPERSLALINSAVPDQSAAILDVGGGTSTLVDGLLAQGYSDLTVLDVSEAALARSKARLGQRAGKVSWIVADITAWRPPRTWRVWHDRAVFHFLTATADQDAYIRALKAATAPGAMVVMSCFALDGPEKCSGLPVQRYSAAILAARIGGDFELVSQASERHLTPWQSVQNFSYAVLKRR